MNSKELFLKLQRNSTFELHYYNSISVWKIDYIRDLDDDYYYTTVFISDKYGKSGYYKGATVTFTLLELLDNYNRGLLYFTRAEDFSIHF